MGYDAARVRVPPSPRCHLVEAPIVEAPDVQCRDQRHVHDLGRLINENMQAYWFSFGSTSAGTVFDDGELAWSYTGGPYLNRVTRINLDETDADRRIEETHQHFGEHGAAVTRLVTPTSRPMDLAQRLQGHNCTLQERWLGMAADPRDIDLSPIDSTSLRIADLDGNSDLRAWSALVGEVYQLPTAARATMYRFFTEEAAEVGDHWRHYLAFDGNTPVATATLFLGSRTAGIYLVSTHPQYQRRGFGRALTAYAARDAMARGYDLIVLQATEEGKGLYERLGFKGIHVIDAYRWAPSSFPQRLRRFLSNKLPQ